MGLYALMLRKEVRVSGIEFMTSHDESSQVWSDTPAVPELGEGENKAGLNTFISSNK